ncbi:alpha/beta hydrolase [Promineifilum sp.]|uniref:alpha/beta hydrolase n=1 Tax=Promineifilum sp. TaxID=2664178 RepID=UPI0035AE2606
MTFKRVMKFLGLLFGFLAGVTAVIVAWFTRRMVAPARQPLWATPSEMGLAFENVQFPAKDGVRLSGWFIPAAGSERGGASIILVHGWAWNRLGDAAGDLLADLSGMTPVELLRLAHALHYEGYHVLMFDLRNHGESAAQPPVTFGLTEANDLLGAIAYMETRPEVNAKRLGVIGFSMGANALLYALPQTIAVCAAIAVQPTTISSFAEAYATDLMGLPGRVILPLVEAAYTAISGVRLTALQPAFAAAGAGATPVLFIQCKEDPWGSMEDANRLAAATPLGEGPLYVDGSHHYQGYQYLVENPRIAVAYFEQYF